MVYLIGMDYRVYNSSNPLPKWVNTKFPNRCMTCGETQSRGTRVLYFPVYAGKRKTGKIMCVACGEKENTVSHNEALDPFEY